MILGCPLAGIDADEIIDGTPQIAAIGERYIGDSAFSNLPRKFKSSISGCAAQCAIHEINDVAFVGVVNENAEQGFDLWVGGGLSTNPMIGKRLGTFVRPDQVAEVWAGVAGLFRDYGYRRLRHRARIKFLVADWGPERFREVLEKEYLGYALPDGPAPTAPPHGIRDHVGVHAAARRELLRGLRAHRGPGVGRPAGRHRRAGCQIRQRPGAHHHRAEDGHPRRAPGAHRRAGRRTRRGRPAGRPSAFRRHTMACTGIEFCKLAIVETKARAADLISELERRLPDFDAPVTINVNGCPNSCARIQTADIGLKGSLVTGPDGGRSRASRCTSAAA